MRSIHLNRIQKYPKINHSFKAPFSSLTGINLLIGIHVILFIIYKAFDANTLLAKNLLHGPVNNFAEKVFAISSSANHLNSNWWSSIFTYQFIHFSAAELILSMGMLWLFGHILKKRIGQARVLFLYLLGVTISAMIFIISHQVFTVFAGPNGVLEGAIGGALAVMTCTVTLFKSYAFKISDNFIIPLWKVYLVVLLLSFVLFYKNNISYILVYLCSIYCGYAFAERVKSRQSDRFSLN